MILHVWSKYEMTGDTLRRHEFARSTWPKSWVDRPLDEPRRLFDDGIRQLPYIKDIINEVIYDLYADDCIVLTNADTCLAPIAEREIARISNPSAHIDCLYSYRRDFPVRLTTPPSMAEINAAPRYPGCDLFAFRVQWWLEHEAEYPDMLLATEAWDWCLRVLMQQSNYREFTNLIYHEVHPNVWEHQNHLPSQQHNRKLATEFLARYNVRFGKELQCSNVSSPVS